jgi:hypothetical protein
MAGMLLALDLIINWPSQAHISYGERAQKGYNMMPSPFLKKAIDTTVLMGL